VLRGALRTGDVAIDTQHTSEPAAVDGPHRLTSSQGQQGLYSRQRLGRRPGELALQRTLVTFQDRTYGYALCLDTPEQLAGERSQQVLLTVASSVQLLPGAQLAGPPTRSDQVLKMWDV
jgi:hypothetical protein